MAPVLFAAALAGAGNAMPSTAQALVDPTRPPEAIGTPAEGEARTGGPALQTIVVSAARRIAVIDGRALSVGDKVGEARVIAIELDSVRLRAGSDVTVLKLVPDVDKTVKPAAPSDSQKSRRR